MSEDAEAFLGLPPQIPAAVSPVPPAGGPGPIQPLSPFPVVAVILLHYVTCGIFTMVWLNLLHGKLPKVRTDDPSAGKAIGFCFIPFFNLYWIFFVYRRLCLRLAEQRQLAGLPANDLRGLATTNCIFQVIPYINGLIGYTIITPIFAGLVQASVNELAGKTILTAAPPETAPAAPLTASLPPVGLPPTPPAPGQGTPGWAIALIVCGALLIPAVLAALLLPALASAKKKAQRINCVNNLKQVGLSFRLWAGDNSDQFPFNVSTNTGGTLEWCRPGADRLDQNSWRHFQVMSNELSTPKILVCPSDAAKHPALNFSQFQAENVTYLIHSGTNITDADPSQVLAICPVHHNVVLADGSVQSVSESEMRRLLNPSPAAP